MNVNDCAIDPKEEAGKYDRKQSAATGSSELNSLFSILAEAERQHHDALVQLRDVGPQTHQFKLHGGACLFKTTPGKA
jgi:hypothetical protein